jgi:hypothetical protein
MALIVTVEVDEERLRRAGLGTSEENVLTELDALRDDRQASRAGPLAADAESEVRR